MAFFFFPPSLPPSLPPLLLPFPNRTHGLYCSPSISGLSIRESVGAGGGGCRFHPLPSPSTNTNTSPSSIPDRRRLHEPNQRRDLDKLPTELRRRNFDYKCRPAHANRCGTCRNAHATCTCSDRAANFARHRWWLGMHTPTHTHNTSLTQFSQCTRFTDF